MTAFLIPDPFPVFFDRLGEPAIGGRLDFFDAGTSTPKDVYGDEDLTVNNGSSVLIGTDGRAVDEIWGDGAYYIRLIAADGSLIADADNVAIPGGASATIPPLASGKFLTNDGAILSWSSILQVPDPTGQSGKILGTDGANLTWQAVPVPENGTSDVDVTTAGVTINDGTAKIQILTGTAQTPNSGGRDASVAVTFTPAFLAAPLFIGITPRYGGTVSTYGNAPIPHVSVRDGNGFTAALAGGERDDSNSGYNFNTAITFDWVAIGMVAIPTA